MTMCHDSRTELGSQLFSFTASPSGDNHRIRWRAPTGWNISQHLSTMARLHLIVQIKSHHSESIIDPPDSDAKMRR